MFLGYVIEFKTKQINHPQGMSPKLLKPPPMIYYIANMTKANNPYFDYSVKYSCLDMILNLAHFKLPTYPCTNHMLLLASSAFCILKYQIIFAKLAPALNTSICLARHILFSAKNQPEMQGQVAIVRYAPV